MNETPREIIDLVDPFGNRDPCLVLLRTWVPGIPKPQGSKQSGHRRDGSIFMREVSSGLKSWRHAVTTVIAARMRQIDLNRERPWVDEVPCVLACEFVFPSLAKHFRKDGSLKPEGEGPKISAPDTSKLLRAVEDSITDAELWQDDAREVALYGRKRYGRHPGVNVLVGRIVND